MKNLAILLLINLIVSFSVVLLYNAMIAMPALRANTAIKVIDLDYFLKSYEKRVSRGEMTIEEYKVKAQELKQYLTEEQGIVINKYAVLGEKLYPIVFNGLDITDDIANRIRENNNISEQDLEIIRAYERFKRERQP